MGPWLATILTHGGMVNNIEHCIHQSADTRSQRVGNQNLPCHDITHNGSNRNGGRIVRQPFYHHMAAPQDLPLPPFPTRQMRQPNQDVQ